jgi:hypothetical protein
MSVTQGSVITLLDQETILPPEDKSFDGWKSGGKTYVAQEPFTVTANAEFVAQWTDGIDPDKTYIKFKNLEKAPVILHSDPAHQVEIARVPAEGTKLLETEPKPQGTALYPRFELEIDGVPLSYDGPALMIRIDEKKVNNITIPALATLETAFAYIKIKNPSFYSLTFNQGSYELPPLGAASTIIMPDETGTYQIDLGAASLYSVMRNGSIPLAFPTGAASFNWGVIYTYEYDGSSLKLSSTDSILETVRPGMPASIRVEAEG